MSQEPTAPPRDPSGPDDRGAPASLTSARRSAGPAAPANDAEPANDVDPTLAGDGRRGIGEWAVVLLLVALIVGVAWSQFGPLFDASTAGTGSAAQGAPQSGDAPMPDLTGGAETDTDTEADTEE